MSEKIEQFWRDATAEDIAKVMRGEKVEARFRDSDKDEWTKSLYYLSGYDRSNKSGFFWICNKHYEFAQCQVYDPPQWWINKPDPGEGYRLLEKFPSEPKLATDQVWNWGVSKWQSSARSSNQAEHLWYRRRIETVKVESRSKDYIPSGWAKLSDDEPRLASDAYWSQGASEWCLIGDSRVEYVNRDKWPAIRQFENWRCMQLLDGCFYRLPNGQGIKVYKQGFEVL